MIDKLISPIISKASVRKALFFLCRILLRKIYNEVHNEELRSIAKQSGTPVWVLVLINVILDSLVGSTSGGARTAVEDKGEGSWKEEVWGVEGGHSGKNERMHHFRTLDWGMEELREMMVVLEYVYRKSNEPYEV